MAASAAMVTSASLVSSPPPRGARPVLPVSVRLSPRVGGGAGLSKPARRMTAFCSLDAPKDDIPIELKYPAFPTVMDINQIRDILPHRFPFLLVDRVVECSPGVSIVAIKNVTINDNFFPGHFPDGPIMPGVLMVECHGYPFNQEHGQQWLPSFKAMAQVGGILLQSEIGHRNIFFFGGIDKVRFRKPVVAGDTLVMRMNMIKLQKRFGIAKMEGKASVGGEVVCEGEFLMAFGSE